MKKGANKETPGFKQLCLDILSLDKDIRFVCIVVVDGKIMAAEYRKDVTPIFTMQEAELAIMQALIRMNTRKTMEHRLGRPLFSITEYEKLVRSTLLVQDLANIFGLGTEFAVICSMEKTTVDPLSIIKEKIIPLVSEKLAK